MKSLITDIQRFSLNDGPGIRTTVFFKGCNMHCTWCHNPETLSFESDLLFYSAKCIHCGKCFGACPAHAHQIVDGKHTIDRSLCIRCGKCAEVCYAQALTMSGKEMTVEEILAEVRQDKPYYETSGGGVTLSGGECLMQPEFAAALAKALTEKGVRVNIDTCGFVSRSALEGVIPYTDTFLYDLKAIDSQVHKRCTGQENGIILENLAYLCSRGCKIEIRYPLVMGYNDKECAKIGEFLQNKPGITRIKVLQYHDFAASRYAALGMENTMPQTVTTLEDVANAVNTLKNFGLNAVDGRE
jgi:pyruvate formate lyase activating enzyme